MLIPGSGDGRHDSFTSLPKTQCHEQVTMDRLSCTYSWRTVRGAVDVAAGDCLADRGRGHWVLVPSRRDLHRVRVSR
jgi:hypothetical protein